MSDWKPRYVIVGAGAIGSTLAVLLARAGSRVICIARPAFAGALKEGINLSLDGNLISHRVDAVSSIDELEPSSDDVLLITTKSQDTEEVVKSLRNRYSSTIPIVSLQNAVSNEGIAAQQFERVYAGLVFFSSTQLSQTEIYVPPGRVIAIGLYPEGVDEISRRFVEDLSRAGFDAIASAHVMSMKYAKLIANLNNATHAITGYWLELGTADDDMRKLMLEVREEGMRVLDAARISIEPPAGETSPINIRAMTEKLRKPAKPGARIEAENLTMSERTYASTWQDLNFGRKTNEAEFLNGEIVTLGRKYGVATPYNSVLLEIVSRMFREVLKPGIYSPVALHELIQSHRDQKEGR